MSHIHIPDGVLPLWLWLPSWLLALTLVGLAGKISERADVRRKVPLLGVVSALMLVAMSSEIVPIAYHINLTVIGGILLGPMLAIVAAFIVEVVLAMLGHGGVTVLGLNTLIVAAEMVIGWALFRAAVGVLGSKRAGSASAVATVITLAITTTMLVGVVALAGGGAAASRETGALDPRSLQFANTFSSGVVSIGLFSGGEASGGGEGESALSVKRFAAVVYTLGPIGWLIEALVTAAIIAYVARVRPTLLFAGALAEERRAFGGDELGGH